MMSIACNEINVVYPDADPEALGFVERIECVSEVIKLAHRDYSLIKPKNCSKRTP